RDDTPLTIERVRQFVEEDRKPDGPRLARRFLARAKAARISSADALDTIQDMLVAVLQRIDAGTATEVDIHPPYILQSGMRDAVKKVARREAVYPIADRADARSEVQQRREEEVRSALLGALTRSLSHLPESDRDLFCFCAEGGRQVEAAGRLGVHQGTVSR